MTASSTATTRSPARPTCTCWPRGRPRRLTRLNQGRLRGVTLGDAEQFSFAGANGDTVYGYVLKPAGFDPARRYPVAFIIHGGPQGSMGNAWHYRWNAQVFAGAGYAVVMIDFHGSTGYGQAFTDSIRGDWGGRPLEDLKQGFATALDRYPFLDPTRAAALGASYGGYMINLIAGVWNEPWRCLVTHDGNLDERFAYFATEELWFPEWEHGGTPWENPAGYEKHNPVDHIAAWHVPTLVDPRRPGLPGQRDRGPGRLHRPPAPGRPVTAAPLPRREPLGPQARELRAVARHRPRVARSLDGLSAGDAAVGCHLDVAIT